MCTASVDALVLWDMKNFRRKKSLGPGAGICQCEFGACVCLRVCWERVVCVCVCCLEYVWLPPLPSPHSLHPPLLTRFATLSSFASRFSPRSGRVDPRRSFP